MQNNTRRRSLLILGALTALPFVWPLGSAQAATQSYDFGPEQKGRVRAPQDPGAQRLLSGYRFVTPGVLTVAIAPEVHFRLPFGKDLLEPGRTESLSDLVHPEPLGHR